MSKILKNIALILLFLFCSSVISSAEEITITTYYPSPYGVYNEVRAKRLALGDNYIKNGDYDWESTDGDGGEIDYNADLVVEGNVGIGTASPGGKLQVVTYGVDVSTLATALSTIPSPNQITLAYGPGDGGTSSWLLREKWDSSNWGLFHDNSRDAFHFVGNGLSRLMIDLGGGNVGIGITSPSSKLSVAGAIESTTTPGSNMYGAGLILHDEATGGVWQLHSHGDVLRVYNGSTESIVGDQTSSIRFKENVKPLSGILEKIAQLKPVSFKYKPKYYDGRKSLGFIAEETLEVFPEVVSLDGEGKPYSINYGLLSTVAISGIQEQQVIIKTQEERIEALQARMDILKNRLDKVERNLGYKL